MWHTLFNIAWRVGLAVVVLIPVVLMAIAVTIRIIGFIRRNQFAEGLPCPECGYDCRMFDARKKSHRCPECGTELRWGQKM